jgi:hypothetical protein
MMEPGWLSFYEAAHEVVQRFGVSRAEAEAQLRQGCADQKLRSMKAPIDGNCLPFEFWTRVAPSEWRDREVDYDGPDADGCEVTVMINEADFRYWLSLRSAQGNARKQAQGKAPLIIEHLKEMHPHGVPDPTDCPRKALRADLLARDKRLEPLNHATLKSAIDAYNRSIRNDPK